MMDVRGKRVVVVGMAKSGVAAVELLREKGALVSAVDQKPAPGVLPQEAASFAGAELLVLSPGVPADLPLIEDVRRAAVPVIGDLELASWYWKGEVIGITGSNGKTTTTALVGHILASSGIPAQVGGNIGTPPCSMVATSREGQWNVLELSSFQLETTVDFRAHIGAALNVTPDHLDRHGTIERYAACKERLFVNQRPGDYAVLNADDPWTRSFARHAGTPVWFSLSQAPLLPVAEIPLRGSHNVENVMAAAAICKLAGATDEQIRGAVRTFPGVEHRLEFVRELDGVAWYNDSKATNVDAALKAIAAFPSSSDARGLWIILGGKDKNSNYTPIAAALQNKAHAALLIGAAAPIIERHLGGSVPVIQCGDITRAIAYAREHARAGDTVLLAPACASFDQFDNFEHRGREFKRLVRSLEAAS